MFASFFFLSISLLHSDGLKGPTMSFYWWFFFIFVPLIILIAVVSAQLKICINLCLPSESLQVSAHKRRQRLLGVTHRSVVHNPVVYTVPTPVYVQPVHNNFPNTRHVSQSTLVAEQRLNQHYAAQHQQPPPYDYGINSNQHQNQRY